jgi:L-galactose dehydrogenase
MLYRALGKTGLSVSRIGFGASPLGDVFGRTDPAEGVKAVHRAIDLGINFVDVSPYYGNTLAEERLGKALVGLRSKVVLATKCGRYGPESFDFSAGRIRRSIDESLVRLQTDYVDLFQAHDIEFSDFDQFVSETLPALREIQRSGKARYIGITGYPLRMLVAVAERERVDTILSYCHYNLLVTDVDACLVPFTRAKGIGLINASPLHMGLLSGSEVPEWHPAPMKVRRAAVEVAELCREHGFNPAVVALSFCIRHPYIASTLVGMSTREEVDTNVKALDFELSPTFVANIEEVVAPAKDILWPSGRDENADPPLSYEARQQLQ